MKTFKFLIEEYPDPSAGFLGFNETITVSVESGDLGDDNSELGFILEIEQALKDWYDTPHIRVVRES